MKEINISKEDLQRYFVEERHTRAETGAHFGVKPYVIGNLMVKYGLERPSRKELLAQLPVSEILDYYSTHGYWETCQKFGIKKHHLDKLLIQNDARKSKLLERAIRDVSKEDLKQYYLTENHSQKETKEHFGISIASLIRLIGLYNLHKDPKQTSEVQARVNLEKYGVASYRSTDECKAKIRNTCQQKYGVMWPCLRPEAKIYSNNSSKPNLAFAKLLTEAGIEFSREYVIRNKSYDFRVGNKLIEINPFSTHNSTWGIHKNSGLVPDYHKKKSQLAKEHGFQCIHVFDWDDRSKILKLLQPRTNLYARKLKVQKISQTEANALLKENHLQGPAKMQTACYGLFLNESLIEVMTFGKPRFNKNHEWELIRLCTKAGYCVIGGAERLFKAFLNEYNPDSVVSYCDNAKFTGNVYTRLGFTLKTDSGISKHWYNPENKIHITDNGLRMQGFDRLLGDLYGKFGKGTSNEDLMRSHGFVEIYDAGQSTYIWQKG